MREPETVRKDAPTREMPSSTLGASSPEGAVFVARRLAMMGAPVLFALRANLKRSPAGKHVNTELEKPTHWVVLHPAKVLKPSSYFGRVRDTREVLVQIHHIQVGVRGKMNGLRAPLL